MANCIIAQIREYQILQLICLLGLLEANNTLGTSLTAPLQV